MEAAALLDFFDDDAEIVNVVVNVCDFIVNDIGVTADVIPEKRRKVPKNYNYYEDTLPLYSMEDFKGHFRMNRSTVQMFVETVQNDIGPPGNVPLEKKMLITIWVLSKQESFLAVGDRFGICKSTCHTIFKDGVKAISNLRCTEIVFPSVFEQTSISQVFEERSGGLPGVIGAIDGCHIPIKQPQHNAVDYYNRKSFHSLIVQCVCDKKAMFRDVFEGMPGRCHDARVFRNSPLYEKLLNDRNLIGPAMHLIGDAAYPLSPFLITPFRNNGYLTPQKIGFNMKLSSIRSVIERSFAFLKGRFRRLKYLDISNVDFACKVIMSACVLHNIVIREGGYDEEAANVDNDDVDDDDDDVGGGPDCAREVNVHLLRGAEKRDHIVNLVNAVL